MSQDDFGLELVEETIEQTPAHREAVYRSIAPQTPVQRPLSPLPPIEPAAVESLDDTFIGAVGHFTSAPPPPKFKPMVTSYVELCILQDRSELKFALAAHLDCQPDDIRIEHDDYGKPRIVSHRIHYSISHAAGRTLLAIGSQRIGVDLDRTHRPWDQTDGLMRYFTEAERAVLSAIPHPRRSWLIMQCWARKEAFAKATGLGLRIGLDTFGVFDGNPAEAQLTGGRTFGWQVMDVTLTGGYAAAVVGPVGFDIRWAGRAAA